MTTLAIIALVLVLIAALGKVTSALTDYLVKKRGMSQRSQGPTEVDQDEAEVSASGIFKGGPQGNGYYIGLFSDE